MILKFSILLSCALTLVSIAACSSSEQRENNHKTTADEVKIGQTSSNLICFNHSLLVVDSVTYSAAVNSTFMRQFAFSHEKHLSGYHGFYLIGKTNYIELFHPKSFEGEVNEPGTTYIRLASLKANYLTKLNKEKRDFIELTSDDYFNTLSLNLDDSTTPIETCEMRKMHYESWTKKKYHDTTTFLPVDYNSPQESDSSSNYLMKDVNGIGLSLNPNDSSIVISYLKEMGYDQVSKFKGRTRLSNNDQFIELHVSKKNKSLSINRFYIQLNKPVERVSEVIGNSKIECDGKSAIWIFE